MKNNHHAAVQADAAATPAAARTRRPQRMARKAGVPNQASGSEVAPEQSAAPHGPSKIASVIALLSREQGATLAEVVAATGWLPHTTRAALTGLRKKGHSIAKTSREGSTCYRIEGGA